MISLTPEIKSKMRKMALIHFVLGVISFAAIYFLGFTGRGEGQFLFSALFFLNMIAMGLLAVYAKREKFP